MALHPVAADQEPPLLTFDQILESMRAFANAGLKDCVCDLPKLPSDARGSELKLALMPSNQLIGVELNEGKLKAGTNNRFMPLPSLKHVSAQKTKKRKSYLLGFFRPRFLPRGIPTRCRIETLLICKDEKKILGLSFESGARTDDPHRHAHLQFRRKFSNFDPETDVMEEFIQSYPAFPTRSRPMGDTWLSVLVSLYGLSSDRTKGLMKLVNEVAKGGQLLHGPQMMTRAHYLFDQG